MSKLVVDASVAAKWLVTEQLSDRALALLERSDDFIAPDLLLPEVGNILWKKVRSGDLTTAEAEERLRALVAIGIELTPSELLIGRALAIAVEAGRTVYDSLYLALAEREDSPFVSADERLVNALSHRPIGIRVTWLGSL